jgi:ketosteroid isomerase-like protein
MHVPPASPFLGVLAVASLTLSGCRFETVDEEANDLQTSVERMLGESSRAWNEGRIEGFLDDYLNSESTTYIGGAGLVSGFDGIRQRFAPLFAAGVARDSLRFEEVRARRLGAIYGVVTARWILHRSGSVTGSGPLTLVVRRVGGYWKIIHDHSSSDSPAAAEP